MNFKRLLWGFSVLAVLLGAAVSSWLALERIERVYLADLEKNMEDSGRTLAEAYSITLAENSISKDELAHIQDVITNLQNASGSRIRIFSGDRQVILDSFGYIGGQEHLKLRPEVLQAFSGKYGAYTRYADETEKSLALFVALPVFHENKVVGVIYISHNTDEILRRLGVIRHAIRDTGIVLILLAALYSFYFIGNLKIVLVKMRDASVKISGGNLDDTVEIKGKGEIAEIAENFNRLAGSLRAKVAELEEEKEKTKRFIQDISHELKTPITGLAGSAEALLSGGYEDRQTGLRFIKNIKKETERLSRLVADLLEIQKLEYYRYKKEKFDIASLAEKVIENFDGEAAKRKITVRLNSESKIPAAGDPEKISTVMENLLENSLRFSPGGGEVTIDILEKEGWINVIFSDQGPGIPEEEQAKIFERFYRGNGNQGRATGGAGLGLSIAREIVSKHGGHIGVRSAAGQGSQFFFTLEKG